MRRSDKPTTGRRNILGLGAAAALAPATPRAFARSPGRVDARVADASTLRALGLKPDAADAAAREFAAMLDEGLHPAAQLAVFRDGSLAYAFAGGAGADHGSLFQIRSVTKALTTMVVMRLVESGALSLDVPVARVWPEFGQRGKHAITLRQVLAHRAGIPDGPMLGVRQLGDPQAEAEAIALLSPLWTPGASNGYHAATMGGICDALARRVAGASVATLFARDYGGPLALGDLFIGLPEDRFARMLPMTVDPLVAARQETRAAFSDFLNTRAGIALSLPWVSGVATALDLARAMTVLAGQGVANGHRYFEPRTLAEFAAPTNAPGDVDRRLLHPVRWGSGFILGDTPDVYGSRPRPVAVGHAGGGASVAWADPAERLVVAFLCNRMMGSGVWARYRRVADSVYRGLA